MSLTSQLKEKGSPILQFYERFEYAAGMKVELSQSLLNNKPILPLLYKPKSTTSYSFAGTATDYLLRYTIQNNSINFEDTFAYKTVQAKPTMTLPCKNVFLN